MLVLFAVSNNALPTQRLSIAPLVSRSRYTVRVTAHNNAGSTVHLYNFTTPAAQGAEGGHLLLERCLANLLVENFVDQVLFAVCNNDLFHFAHSTGSCCFHRRR